MTETSAFLHQPGVPTRHPEQPRPVPWLLEVGAWLWRVRELDQHQWDRMGESLLVGDEPMDRLLDWMTSAGLKTTRELFDRALAEGIASVPEAPEPLRDFFLMVEEAPDWVDWDRIRRGQAVMRRTGADGIYIARDISLCGGYMFSGFNQTLLRTGALEKGSNQRFAETFRWALDVVGKDGMEPLGPGYASTVRVRLIHAFVRRHVAAMEDWRADEWGLPVNQTDMAATLVGTFIAPALSALGMGVVLRPRELDDLAHLVRYVGWLIGVDDEWLPTTFRDGVQLLYRTTTSFSTPDETSKLLAVPMIDDPLVWHYPNLAGLRRRFARAQHLSLTSALGPRAMRSLGLPVYHVPWYPVLKLPVNVVRSVAALTLPGGLERAATRGGREQTAFLRTVIGGDVAVGESIPQVRRAA